LSQQIIKETNKHTNQPTRPSAGKGCAKQCECALGYHRIEAFSCVNREAWNYSEFKSRVGGTGRRRRRGGCPVPGGYYVNSEYLVK